MCGFDGSAKLLHEAEARLEVVLSSFGDGVGLIFKAISVGLCDSGIHEAEKQRK